MIYTYILPVPQSLYSRLPSVPLVTNYTWQQTYLCDSCSLFSSWELGPDSESLRWWRDPEVGRGGHTFHSSSMRGVGNIYMPRG